MCFLTKLLTSGILLFPTVVNAAVVAELILILGILLSISVILTL